MTWFNKMMGKPGEAAAPDRAQRPAGGPGKEGVAASEVVQPRTEDPPEAWIAAVCRTTKSVQALEWLAGIQGDAALGEVAMHARLAEVRLAAARRIESAEVLERVAESCRDKDKGVYRHCHELLRTRRNASVSLGRAGELAQALRLAIDAAPIQLSGLLELEHELKALSAGSAAAEAEVFGECWRLLEQGRIRLQGETLARRDLQTWAAGAEALRGEIEAGREPEAARLDAWRVRQAQFAAAAAALPAWLALTPPGKALAAALAECSARIEAIDADLSRARQCEAFLDALEGRDAAARPGASHPADAEATAADPQAAPDPQAGPDPQTSGTAADDPAALQAQWDALEKPADPLRRAALESRWKQRMAPPPAPAATAPRAEARGGPGREAAAKPRPDREEAKGRIEKLEAAVAQGHLIDADAEVAALAALSGGQALPAGLESRLQKAKAQLVELHRWARWGTDQARDHLITAAESLLAANATVADLAREVPALREEWKKLNAQGPSSKGQWERFDRILEKAFAPVLAQRAEEAKRHAEVKGVKDALCTEWEAHVAAIAWDAVDNRQLDEWRQKVRSRWQAAGMAGFREERQLRKRLDAITGPVDRHLDAARKSEHERRQALIASAEGLAGEGVDTRRATAEIKALQERWQQSATGLRLDRKLEQKLWQRFRAACDQVFARRDEERGRHAAERDARNQARKALLDAFSAKLDAASGSDSPGALNEVRSALNQFRSDWNAAVAGERDLPGGLEARVRELEHAARRLMDSLTLNRHRAEYDLLARKADIAAALEASALAQASGEAPSDPAAGLAAARAAWDALPKLAGKAEALLVARLAAAPRVDANLLAAGQARRAAILLDLEIALGLPSPEHCADERRRRQFERLQKRFAADAAEPQNAPESVATWYAVAAAPDPALDRRMAAVVKKLVDEAAEAARVKAAVAAAPREFRDSGKRPSRPDGRPSRPEGRPPQRAR